MQPQPIPSPPFIVGMGVFAWILIPMALITVATIVKAALDVTRNNTIPVEVQYRRLHPILFWGSLTAVFGLLGQIMGLWQAILAIMTATDINPQIVMMGFRTSFNTTLFGLVSLTVAGIAWYLLSVVVRRRETF